MINSISFPNLNIGPFEINRVALELFGFKIYWYGIIICTGIILGFLYLYLRIKSYGMNSDNLCDIALCTVPCAIIGARLYYVVTSPGEFDSFYEMIAIWNGGIAIYGAIIGGAVALFAICKIKKFPVLKVFDAASVGVMLGQIIGRWGNFVNAEAFGVTDKYQFLGKTFDIANTSANNPFIMSINGNLVHPTFLYESVWNIAGFVLINVLWNKKKFDGQILLWYLTWYGLGRCVIEGFRGDSLFVGNIRISQALGLVCAVIGIILTVVIRIRISKKTLEENQNGNNN